MLRLLLDLFRALGRLFYRAVIDYRGTSRGEPHEEGDKGGALPGADRLFDRDAAVREFEIIFSLVEKRVEDVQVFAEELRQAEADSMSTADTADIEENLAASKEELARALKMRGIVKGIRKDETEAADTIVEAALHGRGTDKLKELEKALKDGFVRQREYEAAKAGADRARRLRSGGTPEPSVPTGAPGTPAGRAPAGLKRGPEETGSPRERDGETPS